MVSCREVYVTFFMKRKKGNQKKKMDMKKKFEQEIK